MQNTHITLKFYIFIVPLDVDSNGEICWTVDRAVHYLCLPCSNLQLENDTMYIDTVMWSRCLDKEQGIRQFN